jgi:hypothetical protein
MPFPPELNSRINAIRASMEGGDQRGDVLVDMKAKLAKREVAGGYSQNAADLKAAISQLEENG